MECRIIRNGGQSLLLPHSRMQRLANLVVSIIFVVKYYVSEPNINFHLSQRARNLSLLAQSPIVSLKNIWLVLCYRFILTGTGASKSTLRRTARRYCSWIMAGLQWRKKANLKCHAVDPEPYRSPRATQKTPKRSCKLRWTRRNTVLGTLVQANEILLKGQVTHT